MNHNFAHRTGLAAAAATALFAGTTQTLAAESGGNTKPPPGQQPTQQPNVNQKKSPQAEVAYRQMKKDLTATSKRLIKRLHGQADAGTQAMNDLAEGEPSDEDLQALVDSIDGTMSEALSEASDAFESKAAKALKKMQRKKASVGQMRKANALVEKLSDSIDAVHEELMAGLAEHFTETFPDADVSFDSGEDDEDADDDDIDDGGDQPPPNGQQPPPNGQQPPPNGHQPPPDGSGGVPNAWPPNPPHDWPSNVAYPPTGMPSDYPPGQAPEGWPSDKPWPPMPPQGGAGFPVSWPPNPPLEWPRSVAYPPSGAPAEYRNSPPQGWPSDAQWPPAPWRDGNTTPPQGQPGQPPQNQGG